MTTFYFKNTGIDGFGSLSTTDPGASTSSTGWISGKTASGNFSALLYGTERAANTFSTTDYLVTTHPNPGSGDSFRSENTLNGTFANANWSFTFAVRAVTSASTQRGRVKFRLWRSVNADGSSATEITSATQSCSAITAISTSADNTSTLTFAPGGTISLSDEYLFVQCEWNITTAGGANGADIDFRASASTIVTSTFTAAISGTLDASESGSDAASVGGAVSVSGTLAALESGGDSASVSVLLPVSGTLAALESGADVFAGTGSVAGDIRGTLAAVETGGDAADLSGIVAVSGISAALESGNDTASIAGTVLLGGSVAAIEGGSDAADLIAAAEVTGALAAGESGDLFAAAGTVGDGASISGVVAAQESAGNDTASVAGFVDIDGQVAGTESGSDAFAASGAIVIAGLLLASEVGNDIFYATSQDQPWERPTHINGVLWNIIEHGNFSGDCVINDYDRSQYYGLQCLRDLLNATNTETSHYSNSTLGLLQNIRDLLNGDNQSMASYTDDVYGVLQNIRDLLNIGNADLSHYPPGILGAWQAINDLAADGL